MCGIAGYFDYAKGVFQLERDVFDRMIDTLAHRGPDGRGRLQEPGVGFGHRRLSIIDVLDRAAQPMVSPDGEVWLTYNGEIYNFPDLRRRLAGLGHRFVTTSDTEVLLHSYLEWGLDCVGRLNGIFAFGIYDRPRRRLLLVRDPLGVKPLLYADVGGRIVFGSEIAPFLELPDLDTSADPQGIDAYFTFGYVPAPMTGYRGIRSLLPGQYLLVEDGRKACRKYWDLPLDAPKLDGGDAELTEEFDRMLGAAVERQMISDVPLGGFLSSGTDSFAIIRAMQNVSRGRTRAFSVGFADSRFDELPWTRQAAAALDVHLDAQVMPLDYQALCPRVAPHCLMPFADSSALPVYQLCRAARRHVTVALSGDGADEMLGGYATYAAAAQAATYRRVPRLLRRGLLAPLARRMPDLGGKYSLRDKAGRFVVGAEEGPMRDHAAWRVILHRELKEKVYTPEFLRQTEGFDPLGLYAEPVARARAAGCGVLDSLLYADQTFYLPNDMLVKVDRMSMAHGLEVRVPFLDVDLVEFCWRLPESMKRRGAMGKIILRGAIAEAYPEALQRRGKSGFNMACDRRGERTVRFDNPFCRPVSLAYRHSFGRYHQLMMRFLLEMLSEPAARSWSLARRESAIA